MSNDEILKIQPLTEEEALNLLPKGDYEGFIRKMEIKPGKKVDENGNTKRFFVATIDVYDSKGSPRTFITWLALDYMIKHLYDACGLSEVYNSGELRTSDCEKKLVTVRVNVQKGNFDFPNPSNRIWDFLKHPSSNLPKMDFDDEIKI